MPLFFDSSMLLLLPAIALAIWAQFKVKSTYAKFAQVPNKRGITGADVAKAILTDAGVSLGTGSRDSVRGQSCGIECIGGHLTDHYDPRARVLRLSEDVHNGTSIAALGIAAHEVGHAVQHAKMYGPLALRNIVYPLCSIGSTLAFPLFFVGLFLPVGLGNLVIQGAIVLFSLAVFFTVLTLPVEFDASRRAVRALSSGGYLTQDELGGAKKVLTAAAMTYVAAAAMAIMQLLRMVLLAQRR
jgi:Zn-dependent membrane protease YugP